MFHTKTFRSYVDDMERIRFTVFFVDVNEARATLAAETERIECSIAEAYERGSPTWLFTDKHVPSHLRQRPRCVYSDLLALRLRTAGFTVTRAAGGAVCLTSLQADGDRLYNQSQR
jgi:hypothetical protein